MHQAPDHTIRLLYVDDSGPALSVWESSVLASHDFLSHEDFLFYKNIVGHFFSTSLPKAPSPLSSVSMNELENPIHGIFDSQDALTGIMAVQKGAINALFIHGKKRGKGYGSALMDFAIHDLGAFHVTVNEQNPPAIRFYIKWGFSIYKRTELDATGRPYPILYMQRAEPPLI